MQYGLTPPKQLRTAVHLPASKSISNRVLLIRSLMDDENFAPQNLSACDDTTVLRKALKEMPEVIDIKGSGTSMRFLTAFLSICGSHHLLTGSQRMKERPIKSLVDALRYLGAQISYAGVEGFPPLEVDGGEVKGGKVVIQGDISSQYISALLLIAPVLEGGLEIKMTGDIASRAYLDMTLTLMRAFGADADWTGKDTISVNPVRYRSRPFVIENDWSAASYWYELLALSDDPDAEILLYGLRDNSCQGDSVIRRIFSLLGVRSSFVSMEEGQWDVLKLTKRGNPVGKLDYNFISSPDLAQTVVATCAALGVPFNFSGLSTLSLKETDRVAALKRELLKLGFVLRSEGQDRLIWDGERCDATSHVIETYDDHRMAMSFAPLAYRYDSLVIDNPEVVTKSYPDYWEDLRRAGFEISIK